MFGRRASAAEAPAPQRLGRGGTHRLSQRGPRSGRIRRARATRRGSGP
jgi:hypothetical protein